MYICMFVCVCTRIYSLCIYFLNKNCENSLIIQYVGIVFHTGMGRHSIPFHYRFPKYHTVWKKIRKEWGGWEKITWYWEPSISHYEKYTKKHLQKKSLCFYSSFRLWFLERQFSIDNILVSGSFVWAIPCRVHFYTLQEDFSKVKETSIKSPQPSPMTSARSGCLKRLSGSHGFCFVLKQQRNERALEAIFTKVSYNHSPKFYQEHIIFFK